MEDIINPAGEQFEMQESPRGLAVNPRYVGDGHRSTANKKRKTRHSDHGTSLVYDHLNFEEATEPLKPAQGSNRALLALVIIVCLISLTALLLTLLMLFGKIGPGNEDPYCTCAPAKSLQSLENIDSALYQLKSALNRTNNDLAELNGTQAKGMHVPSAHLEGGVHLPVDYVNNKVITAWNRTAKRSHVLGGFQYAAGRLRVPENGRYYVYAQMYFNKRPNSNANRVRVYADNRVLLLIHKGMSSGQENTGFTGGVFQLREGEEIYVKVEYDTKLWVGPFHSYFGAYVI